MNSKTVILKRLEPVEKLYANIIREAVAFVANIEKQGG